MIPLVRPDIGEEEISAVTDILRSGMLAQGPRSPSWRRSGRNTSASGTRSR